ncbi:unnamed protein product [Chondrus crispus]|uniref:ZZ-type domain-containing protein n=1 Tax=Chondrus crispus TaxID=2769 RepID=R7Q2Z3_CHOCR|nr:unnamed protein product [Chondrus crispus]CDF32394.1 unnamed protein product [Chondrus crispus]|eukprot:XP_005712059.1 unnamed protein product [Chondrus crispus]
MDQSIILKVTFEGTIRRLPVTRDISFADFHQQLAERFSITVPFVTQYEDLDKDIITFDSDAELNDLFSTIEDTSKPLRISLLTLEEAKEAAKARRSASATDAGNSIPQMDNLICKVSDLVSAMESSLKGTESVDEGCDATHARAAPATAGLRGMADTPMTPCAKPYRKGLFHGLRQYISAFPSGKSGFKKHATSVSPEVKVSFKKLVRYIKKEEDTGAIVSALKDNLPTFRKWLVSDLGDQGFPEEISIHVIVTALHEDLLPKVGEHTTSRITSFVSTALVDEGVVAILRKLRSLGPMPWENGFTFSRIGKQGPRGFDVHHKIQCTSCGMRPIVGSRFKCTNRKNFNLCTNCHGNEQVAKEGMKFTECKYVWENVLVDVRVPPAPLKIGDRGPRVKFLHKVLTDAGYMNESMYLRQMGLFSTKTQAAVKQFQQEQGLGSSAEDGNYDEITANCLENMVETRDMNIETSTQASDQVEPIAVGV